jgi:hypothetical protein
MKIHITTPINIPEIPSEVEMESGTLRDLLKKVFGHVHFSKEIIDPKTGDFKDDSIFEARLNGVSYYSFPKGIDTALSDGDTITLSLMMLGGG